MKRAKRESYRGANAANRKALDAARARASKMERQLVRVVDADNRSGVPFLHLTIPKWSDSTVVRVPLAKFPEDWAGPGGSFAVRKGFRFYAQVNMKAKTGDDLNISGPFVAGGRPRRTRLTDKKIATLPTRTPALTEWYDSMARVREALLEDLGEVDHSECGHDVGHCVHSEAFGILFTKVPPVPPSLVKAELAEVEATLEQAKVLLERLDTAMQGGGGRLINPNAPLDRVLHGLLRATQLMQVGAVRLQLVESQASKGVIAKRATS
jgi:hypothetical protein